MSFTRPSRLLSPTRERIKVRGQHAVRTEEARCVYAPSRSASGIQTTGRPWSEKDEANRGASVILTNKH
jgi:hypothetical protein